VSGPLAAWPDDRPLPLLEEVPFAALGAGLLVFQRAWEDHSGLYVIDVDARSTRAAFGGQRVHGPSVSPDGKEVVFASGSGVPGRAADLFVANIDGTEVRRISRLGQEMSPTWSPDGTRVLYHTWDPRENTSTLYRQSPVWNTPDLETIRPTISFSRGWLVVGPVSERADGRLTLVRKPLGVLYDNLYGQWIYTMERDGSGLALLQPPADPNTGEDLDPMIDFRAPTWSPDGRWIAFLETAGSWGTGDRVMRVHVMAEDGSELRTVAEVPSSWANSFGQSNHFSLCWFADGSRIAFSNPVSEDESSIFVVRVADGAVTRVTTAAGVQDRSVSCTR
jgi:dipeptidyl aminopeptidase/acylaminoacyl peptidase